MKDSKDKARVPILAAGGILLRGRDRPEIALVQLRKMGAWVLPKGKLAQGESAIAAARREVIEETGQRVSVHEFLGTLVYETSGRHKIIQFWRMQALGGPVGELMRDVTAMEWLALDAAMARLTHPREQVFLEQVGPIAIRLAERRPRRSIARRQRPAPISHPGPIPVPALVVPVAPVPPVDLPEPLAAEDLPLAPVVAAAPEPCILEPPAGGPRLFEKTWHWLRQTALMPKPQRD
jgi:8-oxo-dGTP diphosphatase